MKVAIIVRRLDVKGGTQRQAIELARELKRRGHEARLYTFNFSRERCFENLLEGFGVVSLNQNREEKFRPGALTSFLAGRSSFFNDNLAAKRLAFLIDPRTDILNPHDSVAERAAYYFKKHIVSVPSVWSMNDVPLASWVIDKDRLLGNPRGISLFRLILMRLADFYEKKVFIASQDGIAVLDGFNKKLVRNYMNRESTVVHSGLDAEEFVFTERPPISGKTIRVLASGILFPHRRFEDVIGALIFLVRWGFDPRLSIIGDTSSSPQYFSKLSGLIRENNLESRVKFLGRVSEGGLRDAYREHDIFVFANFLQTWGLAVFEAMASGLPVVVSRGAGAHEVLADRRNALLVDPLNPEQIASAVRELAETPGLYLEVSKEGRAFASDRVSWSKYAAGLLAFFEQTLAKHPRR